METNDFMSCYQSLIASGIWAQLSPMVRLIYTDLFRREGTLITCESLAKTQDSSRVYVHRVLQKLQALGLITLKRQAAGYTFTINDPGLLHLSPVPLAPVDSPGPVAPDAASPDPVTPAPPSSPKDKVFGASEDVTSEIDVTHKVTPSVPKVTSPEVTSQEVTSLIPIEDLRMRILEKYPTKAKLHARAMEIVSQDIDVADMSDEDKEVIRMLTGLRTGEIHEQ